MPTETVGEYEIEYSGVPLTEGAGWAAYVTIYGPSLNPMHRNRIFPHQRVSVETVFASEQAAEEHARVVAMGLLH